MILIYLLVVAEFRSYLVPLIIMAPILLTIIGVMPGHAPLHAQFTAISMIGMIALAGIIVRNSILLVDFINLEVASGTPFEEAVIRSSAVRAKPIILTALAAMLGHCSSSTIRSSGAGDLTDLRHHGIHPADADLHPGAVLRGVPQAGWNWPKRRLSSPASQNLRRTIGGLLVTQPARRIATPLAK